MWGSVMQMTDGEEVDERIDLWLHVGMNVFLESGCLWVPACIEHTVTFQTYIEVKR